MSTDDNSVVGRTSTSTRKEGIMPTGVMVVLVTIVLVAAAGLLLVVKAVSGARKNLQVSPGQRQIPIQHWYSIRSQRRRDRALSQVPVPKPDEPGSDETYVWITGLVTIRLWFLAIPSLIGLIGSIVLWSVATGVSQNPYILHFTRNGEADSLNLGRLVALLCSLGAWLVFLASVGYFVNVYLSWSSKFLALSTYRLARIRIYPAWAFWKQPKFDYIELSDITSAGHKRPGIFANAFNYNTMVYSTPSPKGESNDGTVSNEVPFIPDGAARAKELDDLQRVAMTPRERSENDRIVEAVNRLDEHVTAAFPVYRFLPRRAVVEDAPTSGSTPNLALPDETSEDPEE